MSQDDDAKRRTRFLHERQVVVFGIIIAVLAVAGLTAVTVMTGAVTLPFLNRGFSTATAVASPVPCLPAGTLPVAASAVVVDVLNGARVTDLAANTAADLTSRGFTIGAKDNARTYAGNAQIAFGPGSVAQAYTLAAYLESPELVFEATRGDPSVVLTVGSAYTGLKAADKVKLTATEPLVNPSGCVPLADLTTATPTTTATAAVKS